MALVAAAKITKSKAETNEKQQQPRRSSLTNPSFTAGDPPTYQVDAANSAGSTGTAGRYTNGAHPHPGR